MFKLILLFFILVTNTTYAGGGSGGSIVGDGGHVVICPLQAPILFDLYEYAWKNELDLNSLESNYELKYYGFLFSLGVPQIIVDEMLVHAFMNTYSYFVYKTENFQKLFLLKNSKQIKLRGLSINPQLHKHMQLKGCKLKLVVLKPATEIMSNAEVVNYCIRNQKNRAEPCFYVDHKTVQLMDNLNKSCLYLHESLRNVMSSETKQQQNLLRDIVGNLCFKAGYNNKL